MWLSHVEFCKTKVIFILLNLSLNFQCFFFLLLLVRSRRGQWVQSSRKCFNFTAQNPVCATSVVFSCVDLFFDADIWVVAAKWEMEEMQNMFNTRRLLQRGLRFNPDSQHLWREVCSAKSQRPSVEFQSFYSITAWSY